MTKRLRLRRISLLAVAVVGIAVFIFTNPEAWNVAPPFDNRSTPTQITHADGALGALDELPVKGRAPKTGYARAQFGNGWISRQGCDTRNIILARDMSQVETNEKCQVTKGVLSDSYTGKQIDFVRGPETSQAVQIDHVVALSNAWQTGAQQLMEARRIELANDPLNLLAVDGKANQQKSDSDAATWLPPYKPFRCQYIARQIAIKKKYELWVVPAEKKAMERVLNSCPNQAIPQNNADMLQ